MGKDFGDDRTSGGAGSTRAMGSPVSVTNMSLRTHILDLPVGFRAAALE